MKKAEARKPWDTLPFYAKKICCLNEPVTLIDKMYTFVLDSCA